MSNEPTYKLVEFSKEEANEILKEVDTILAKYNAQIAVSPIINPNGTLGAQAQILKKVLIETNGEDKSKENANSEAEISG